MKRSAGCVSAACPLTDDLSYLREFEHITLARVLLARHTTERAEGVLHDATRLLERLLQAAEEGKRNGSVLEILVLQALVHQARGDMPAALASLQRALTLAEPEGYVRLFVDEGPPMASLLRAAAKRGDRPELWPSTPGCLWQDRGQHARQTGLDRATERTRAGRASTAGNRPGRPGHRPRARGVAEHRADSHQEHLRQARREQPSGGGPPRTGARSAVAHPHCGGRPVRVATPSCMKRTCRCVSAEGGGSATQIPSSPRKSPHVVMPPHHIARTFRL